MKILSLNSKMTYEIDPQKNGENISSCPECDQDRKHRGKKSFSWNNTKKTGYCQNCQGKFVEFKPFQEKKEYSVPVWKNKTGLTEKAVRWFEGRGISQGTLVKMKVYSDTEFMPQVNGNASVICFPFWLDERLVNVKYRDGSKNFKLVKDAELIFYNINALKDSKSIVITEGEIDCLSYIESGIQNCISVPNGAGGRNMEYIDNHIELFDGIEKIYIATDNDIKGIELREELIHRFGCERCLVVNFKDCKDANEYLIKYGGVMLTQTIKDAIEIPVSGIVNLSSMYDEIYSMFNEGLKKGKLIGFLTIDSVVSWELGRMAVVTGIPGHGKSEFVDWICAKLNVLHGWKVGFFSPENYPVKYHYSKIFSKITGKEFKVGKVSSDEYELTFNYIEKNFFFIFPEDDMSFENIIIKAKFLVKKHGIRILVIDPYNKIEHLREKGESETEYISRFLDKITVFARQNNVLVFLVAHPRKMDKNKDTGFYNKPNLYDINGSANFYNKCDYGVSVYRTYADNLVTVDFIKVKFRHLGDGGMVELHYNYNNGRYERPDSTIDSWDNGSYIFSEREESRLPVSAAFDPTQNWPDTPPF